jgi:uncharacterized protein (TIGR02266 family)
MSEHRRHPRVPVRQRVWCEGDQLTLFVQALNVSRGGLFVRTASPPAAGDRVRISFRGLREGEVVVQTVVVWTRQDATAQQPGMGLRITGFERGATDFERFVARAGDARRDDDDAES